MFIPTYRPRRGFVHQQLWLHLTPSQLPCRGKSSTLNNSQHFVDLLFHNCKMLIKCLQSTGKSENAGPALPFLPPLSRMQTLSSRHARHFVMVNQCKSLNERHRPRRLSCHPNVYDFSELFEVLLALLPMWGRRLNATENPGHTFL